MSIRHLWPWAHRHYNLARGVVPAGTTKVRSIYPAHAQDIKKPKHVEPATVSLELHQSPVLQRETFHLDIPDGWCHPAEVVLTRQGFLLRELLDWHGNPEDHPALNRSKWFPAQSRFRGAILNLAIPSHDNYFHWVCDTLPLIYACQNEGIALDALYFKQTQPFQLEYLRRLHLDHLPRIDGATVGMVQADHVVAWTHKGFHPPNDWILGILKNQLIPEMTKGLPFQPGGRRNIYLSRDGIQGREMQNELEVWPFLKKCGFEKLLPHRMTIEDQIKAFQEAAVIAGTHGAAFTNLIYCQPATKIIEFLSPQYLDRTFQRLASHFNLDYYLLVGEGIDHSEPDYWTANRASLTVSVDKLEKLMFDYAII